MASDNFTRKVTRTGNLILSILIYWMNKPISGQKFVCISFVSPENIFKLKDQYFQVY